jgi:pimeloyl-ACP methyl ester carboxylesterase
MKSRAPIIGIVLLCALAVPGTGVVVAASLPTNVSRLSAQHAPIEDRSARKAAGTGCALSEVDVDGVCNKAVVTSVRDEEVSFPSSIPEKGFARLRGTLSVPVGVRGKRPAIILVHGSGPSSRNETASGDLVSKLGTKVNIFTELADFFAHQGLVVLRWDKRVPQFYPEYDRTKFLPFRWSDLETDARDALAFLATRAEVEPTALVVAGHSEGGQLAPYIAHENPRVAAVIMLAGPIDDFERGLLGQLDRLADARMAQWDPIGAWQVQHIKSKYEPCFAKLRSPRLDPNEICMEGGITVGALAEYTAYVRRMPEVLAAGSSPVMVVQGTVDRNIDPLAVPEIGRALGTRDHELHYVPGVNHDLVNVVTPTNPPHIDTDIERRLAAFLASVRPR